MFRAFDSRTDLTFRSAYAAKAGNLSPGERLTGRIRPVRSGARRRGWLRGHPPNDHELITFLRPPCCDRRRNLGVGRRFGSCPYDLLHGSWGLCFLRGGFQLSWTNTGKGFIGRKSKLKAKARDKRLFTTSGSLARRAGQRADRSRRPFFTSRSPAMASHFS